MLDEVLGIALGVLNLIVAWNVARRRVRRRQATFGARR
jgi:hypothetical protein